DPQIWTPLQGLVQYYGSGVQTASPATPQYFGGATLTAFQHQPDGSADDQFDSSLVLLLEYAGVRTLLSGGIHASGESSALKDGLAYPIDIFEAADGGSTSGASDGFLQRLFQPDVGSSCRVGVSSQGPDRRGGPTLAGVRARLSQICPQVYVTAENGTVV